jgi:DNA-binding CsgD family transcriptional regulator
VPALSPREAEVVARIAHGLSADGIAAELDVAPSTVVTLRKRAYAKLAEAGLPADRLRLARWLA